MKDLYILQTISNPRRASDPVTLVHNMIKWNEHLAHVHVDGVPLMIRKGNTGSPKKT